ncbi:hypothetical protein Ancab_011237, partial [Ancistrocladus abbreviatus]
NTLLDDATFNATVGTNDGNNCKEAEDILQTLTLDRPNMSSLKFGPLHPPEQAGSYLPKWSFPSPAQSESAIERWGNKSPLFMPCPEIEVAGDVIEDGGIANMNKMLCTWRKHEYEGIEGRIEAITDKINGIDLREELADIDHADKVLRQRYFLDLCRLL